MPVDANKLAALVEEQNQNPMASMDAVGGEGEAPPEEEEAAGADGEALLSEMGEFGEMLKESADIIVPIAEDIGEDLAGDSEYMPETEDAVAEAVDEMPPEITDGMVENLKDRPLEELNAIGEVLVKEVETAETPVGEAAPMEAEKVGGLLEVSASVAAEDSLPDDEGDDEEPMEEEEPAEDFLPEE